MSETSRKFSRNSVHKWLKRNTTFACRKASTNITNPPGVAQTYSLRTPTVFFAFAGSCAQKWHKSTQTHAQFSCLCCLTDDDFLTKDWIIFLNCNMCLFIYLFDCALHADLRQRHPAKPFSFNCYLIVFATWPCHGATWFCPLATKKVA